MNLWLGRQWSLVPCDMSTLLWNVSIVLLTNVFPPLLKWEVYIQLLVNGNVMRIPSKTFFRKHLENILSLNWGRRNRFVLLLL